MYSTLHDLIFLFSPDFCAADSGLGAGTVVVSIEAVSSVAGQEL